MASLIPAIPDENEQCTWRFKRKTTDIHQSTSTTTAITYSTQHTEWRSVADKPSLENVKEIAAMWNTEICGYVDAATGRICVAFRKDDSDKALATRRVECSNCHTIRATPDVLMSNPFTPSTTTVSWGRKPTIVEQMRPLPHPALPLSRSISGLSPGESDIESMSLLTLSGGTNSKEEGPQTEDQQSQRVGKKKKKKKQMSGKVTKIETQRIVALYRDMITEMTKLCDTYESKIRKVESEAKVQTQPLNPSVIPSSVFVQAANNMTAYLQKCSKVDVQQVEEKHTKKRRMGLSTKCTVMLSHFLHIAALSNNIPLTLSEFQARFVLSNDVMGSNKTTAWQSAYSAIVDSDVTPTFNFPALSAAFCERLVHQLSLNPMTLDILNLYKQKYLNAMKSQAFTVLSVTYRSITRRWQLPVVVMLRRAATIEVAAFQDVYNSNLELLSCGYPSTSVGTETDRLEGDVKLTEFIRTRITVNAQPETKSPSNEDATGTPLPAPAPKQKQQQRQTMKIQTSASDLSTPLTDSGLLPLNHELY